VSLIKPGERPLAGLSTDLYFPLLADLVSHLESSPPGYLEIFRGRTVDLREARRTLPPSLPLTYHGDCLWYTQPDYPRDPAFREEERRALRHMEALESPWMIHECAQKAMEGFSFGLYAPPLLTNHGAMAAREGALALSNALGGRLLLVETPPFPPHPAGEMDLAIFLRLLTSGTPLGIGLDLGHCLTYLAASGRPFDIENTVEWLEGFPLDRVIEIHVGGMRFQKIDEKDWPIDDHASPLPNILFNLLGEVLSRLPLPALQGVALEVDNKSAELAADEFRRFREIVGEHSRRGGSSLPINGPVERLPPTYAPEEAKDGYRRLAMDLSGGLASPYARHLYAEEIWSFGGAMPDLFPETLTILSNTGIDARRSFIDFFNRAPHPNKPERDFLEVKIHRAGEWIDNLAASGGEALSHARETLCREAELLLAAQTYYNGDA